MRKSQQRLAVLSALREDADFSPLKRTGTAGDREMRAFLRWLDQSGIALYLLWRLRETGELENMPARLRIELEGRLERNRRRTNAMLADFRALSESFVDKGIPHAFLKGFTLVPEFCPALELRHQSDLDLLVSPESLDEARATILECGYSSEHEMRGGEMLFSSPLRRVPTADDDIYTADYQRRVELHMTVWEDLEAVSLDLPSDYLARVRLRRIEGIAFSSPSLEDAFIFHLLHAFRHFLGYWTRLSWLWETHYFLKSHRECSGLWIAVRERFGDPVMRKACGLILCLTNRIFGSPIPVVLSEWCIEGLPNRIRSWVARFGAHWALSGLSGSKVSLLIYKEFVRDPKLWRPFLWRRMFPLAGRPSLGEMGPTDAPGRARFRLAQRLYQIRRLVYHGGTLFSLPIEALSWKVSLNRSAAMLAGRRPRDPAERP